MGKLFGLFLSANTGRLNVNKIPIKAPPNTSENFQILNASVEPFLILKENTRINNILMHKYVYKKK